jgi:gliding motility-associated-like protein
MCIGSLNTLTATGGIAYLWAPGGQTASSIVVNPTSVTTYTVTAIDINGCMDNATLLMNVLPPINISISPNTTICAGTITTLTAQGGGPYTWSPGGQSSSIVVVTPVINTTYTVTATNGACSDTAFVTVTVNPLPSASATADPYTINIGNSSTLTGVASTGNYNWSPTTGITNCANCPNPVVSPTVTTVYTLSSIDSAGCVAIDTVIVNVKLECEDIFIPNAFSPNDDGHNDYFRVRNPLPCIKTINIKVYNRWGQKVFETEDPADRWDGTVDGKKADPAVFFYIINMELVTDKYKTFQGNVSLIR